MTRITKRKNKLRIKDLPAQSLPRERLLASGRENLSDDELLAILLGTGTAEQNVLVLSKSLLRRYPLKELSQVAISDIVKFPGVGRSKASRIIAALELGERLFAPESFSKAIIRSTEDALTHLRDIVEKKQEYLIVFYLNARYELLQKEVVGVGTLNSMRITPKEIFSPAVATPCAWIIVAHNHPSGDPTPSDDDIVFTTKIHEAGEVMGIPMLDHLIVGRNGYFSFRDNAGGE